MVLFILHRKSISPKRLNNIFNGKLFLFDLENSLVCKSARNVILGDDFKDTIDFAGPKKMYVFVLPISPLTQTRALCNFVIDVL